MQSSLQRDHDDIEELSNERSVNQASTTDENPKDTNAQDNADPKRFHSSKVTRAQVELRDLTGDLSNADRLIHKRNESDEEADESDRVKSEPEQEPDIIDVHTDSKDHDNDDSKRLYVMTSNSSGPSQHFREVFKTIKTPQERIRLKNNPVKGEDIKIQDKVDELAKLFFEDFVIVWYNPNSDSKSSKKYLTKLNTLNEAVVFHVWQEALEYIQHRNTPLQVIVSGQDAEALVKATSNEPNVSSIYVFDEDLKIHSQWVNAYPRITSVEDKFSTLLSKLHRGSLKLDFPVFEPVIRDADIVNVNRLHLYLIGLTQFRNRDQAKQDLLALAQRVYRDKTNMDEFAQTYAEYDKTAILTWYARESFLYKLVNNCIRLATSDAILSSRLAIRDLEVAIREHYQAQKKLYSGPLYRSGYLSDREWAILEKNVGKDIEMFGFLSTSKVKEVALRFLKKDIAKKTLITIIVHDISSRGDQGFAEIDEFSKYAEDEVLFNIRSRFTIVAAAFESVDLGLEPCRHLVLLYDARALRIDASLYDRTSHCKIAVEPGAQELIICKICRRRCWIGDSHYPELIFLAMNESVGPRNVCYDCLRQRKESSTGYLCISTRDLNEKRKVGEGSFFQYNRHLGIQFYGSQCIGEHHPKNKPIFQRFSCYDCRSQNKVWCLDCFNVENPCLKQKHNVIVEDSPYTYWTERASAKDRVQCTFDEEYILKHLDDQWTLNFSKISGETVEKYYNDIENLTRESEIPKILDLWITEGLSTLRAIPRKETTFGKNNHYNSTIRSFYKALEMKKLIYGEIHSEVASLYMKLGASHLCIKEFQRCIELLHRFLEMQKVIPLETNHETIDAYYKLGLAYGELSDYKKEIEYFLEFLVANNALMGRLNPKLPSVYHKLGEAYLKLNDIPAAIRSFFKSIEILLMFPQDNNAASTAVLDLFVMRCNSSESNGNLKRFYHDALKSLLKVFMDPTKTLVECRRSHNCGQTCKNTIDFETTEDDLNPPSVEVLNSRYAGICKDDDLSNTTADVGEDKLSAEERLTLYFRLANNYYRIKEYQKAVRVYCMILKLFKELHFDLEHPSLVMMYITIAQICHQYGVDDKAIELYSQFLEITVAIFGEEHYNTAVAYSKLASAYESQKDYQKSIELLSWGLEIMKMACGEKHCEVAILYCSIADAYGKQGEHEDAETFYCMGLKMQEEILGDTNEYVAEVYYRLANTYYTAKDYQKALDSYLSVIKIFIELWIHEELPIGLKTAISRVAKICREQGVDNKAVELYSQFLDRISRILEDIHICTKTAHKMLGNACEISKTNVV